MAQLSKDWAGGSVSHATLREEDLIPAFEEVLDTAIGKPKTNQNEIPRTSQAG
jgi:hypothetical protein